MNRKYITMDKTERQNANRQKMLAELRRARNDIAALTDWMELQLSHYSDEEIADCPETFNWGSVGTLKEVRSQLMDTLRFFAGFETTEELQNSLDELNGDNE